jgi:hypothetical protein
MSRTLHVVRVRHITPRGATYARTHAIMVRGTDVDAALRDNGIVGPSGAPRTIELTPMPEICWSGQMRPIVFDPAHIIVHITGVPGGVFVRVPDRCTMLQLEQDVVPARLRGIGVHRYDRAGALYLADGTCARAGHIWRRHPVELWWTKLGVRVSHEWPSAAVIRTIRRAQALHRADEWTTVSV